MYLKIFFSIIIINLFASIASTVEVISKLKNAEIFIN